MNEEERSNEWSATISGEQQREKNERGHLCQARKIDPLMDVCVTKGDIVLAHRCHS